MRVIVNTINLEAWSIHKPSSIIFDELFQSLRWAVALGMLSEV